MTLPLLLYPFMVLLLGVWLPGRTVKAAQLNYDPPLPSSDFGTPEATAKLASQRGCLNVVGVNLGMPVKAELEAVNPA